MSDPVVSPPIQRPATPSRRGQSLVEFALVLPMLLVLLLGIADFGRVFQAGITLEAAARNGAEVVALERLRKPPPPAADPNFEAYYRNLHRMAAETVCREARILPNTSYAADDPATPGTDEEACPQMPVIRVCIHDGGDPLCGAQTDGFSPTIPSECNHLNPPSPPWSNASGGTVNSHAVEVRVCYKFTTLFNLHISMPFGWGISVGDIYLQRGRMFMLDCPPDPADITTC